MTADNIYCTNCDGLKIEVSRLNSCNEACLSEIEALREAAWKFRNDFKVYYAECFKDEAEKALKEFDDVMGWIK